MVTVKSESASGYAFGLTCDILELFVSLTRNDHGLTLLRLIKFDQK